MTATEVLVLVGGLILGYWVVSKLIDDLGRDRENPPGQQAPVKESADAAVEPWHQVLNVSPEATIEEIRESYRRLMGQYHPDKVAALGEELKTLAEHKTKAITAAYREAMQLRGEAA